MMNADEIRKWHKVFYPDNDLFEIRLLGGKGRLKSASGYFKDVEVMISKLTPIVENVAYNGPIQVYFTLNRLPEDLYSRSQHDCFIGGASTTLDTDVARRKFVMIDFDPIRAKGVSSSQAELNNAHTVAGRVFKFLKEQGFNEPVVALSGNGYHLQLKVDMPNDDEHRELIKTFVESVAYQFDAEGIDIDCKVFNAARVCKLYGTEARKGASTAERPWRLAQILYVPKELKANDDSLFKKVADMKPKEQKQTAQVPFRSMSNEKFDLENWLREHGIEYRIKNEGGIVKYQLRKCPWQSSHSTDKDWESMIFRNPKGEICFSCWHDHCKDKKWEDVRELYEPGYKQKTYQRNFVVSTFAPKIQPVIKQEDIERYGKKWLPLSMIKRVDLSTLEKVRTGFDTLDSYITGLFMGEVTLLSGTNGSGKSSWVNTLILNIVNQGWKVALWSGELPAPDLKSWIEMAAAGKHVRPSKNFPGRYYCPNDIGDRIDKWLDGKFAIYNNEYGYQWSQAFNDMQELRKKDVRIFVIDNLMALDIDLLGVDKNEKQKKVIDDIKNFAKTQNCHIILIAHPRKTSGRGKFTLLRKDDIAGTSDLTNMVDNVFIIHRKNEDFLKGYADYYGKARSDEMRDSQFGNFVEICKNRRFGAIDHMCGVYYDVPSRRFKNSMDEDIEYGWNEDANAQMGHIFTDDDIGKDVPF